jgi:hypothetical protein
MRPNKKNIKETPKNVPAHTNMQGSARLYWTGATECMEFTFTHNLVCMVEVRIFSEPIIQFTSIGEHYIYQHLPVQVTSPGLDFNFSTMEIPDHHRLNS